MAKKYYVTTPIYYVNDLPHIGHAYTTFAADILARWHRMKGEDVFYLTGTDENAQKNAEVALGKLTPSSSSKIPPNPPFSKEGTQPPLAPPLVKGEEKAEESLTGGGTREVVQKYVDEMSAKWQMMWDELGISNDDFIRTTEARHIKAVEKFFKAVFDKGDIYEGEYEGYYCQGCEAFVTEADLKDGLCPIHKTKPQKIKEKNLFFKASRYQPRLLKYLKAHPEFVRPESRYNEIKQYVENHFGDFSISRQGFNWGIPVPKYADKAGEQVIYVWFDALINYLTAVGYGADQNRFKKLWPADLHLVGKDIIKFHCAYWPTMLMSAGLPLPKQIFAHGFFTINGQKIGKSLGNAIDPRGLVEKYGLDALRYFLFREIPFGGDGDFSEERLADRYRDDLAHGLGNLIARVTTLANRFQKDNSFSKKDIANDQAQKITANTWVKVEASLANNHFDEALGAIWEYITFFDKYIEETKPWQLLNNPQDKLGQILYTGIEGVRQVAWMVYPFLPVTAEKIISALSLDKEFNKTFKKAQQWGGYPVDGRVSQGKPLFPLDKDQG